MCYLSTSKNDRHIDTCFHPSHFKEMIPVLAALLNTITKYPAKASQGRVYFGSLLEDRVQHEQGSHRDSTLRRPATGHTGSTVKKQRETNTGSQLVCSFLFSPQIPTFRVVFPPQPRLEDISQTCPETCPTGDSGS